MGFTRWYNYSMNLYRVDPEIYSLIVVGFTSIAWGSVLLMRKAGQVRLENRILPSSFDAEVQEEPELRRK